MELELWTAEVASSLMEQLDPQKVPFPSHSFGYSRNVAKAFLEGVTGTGLDACALVHGVLSIVICVSSITLDSQVIVRLKMQCKMTRAL